MATYRCQFCILLFFVLVTFNPVTGFANDNEWPANQCQPQDYWLEFSELGLCIEKTKVVSLKFLNMSEPSAVIRVQFGSTDPLELWMLRLDEKKITGGLHTHLGVTAKQLFEKLLENRVREGEPSELTHKVMDIDKDDEVHHYQQGSLDAFAIVRPMPSDSSLYLFDTNRSGGIQISGQLTRQGVEDILSIIRW